MRLIPVLFLVIAATACGDSIDPDVPIGEQIEDDERSEFITGFIEGSGGVVTNAEAECAADEILGSDLTAGEMLDAQDDLGGDAAAEIAEATRLCVDPNTELEVALEGPVKDQFIESLMASGLTTEQATCFIDGLVERGFDARDIFVSGLEVAPMPDFDTAIGDVGIACL